MERYTERHRHYSRVKWSTEQHLGHHPIIVGRSDPLYTYISQGQLRIMESLEDIARRLEMVERTKADEAVLVKAIKESKANKPPKTIESGTFEAREEEEELAPEEGEEDLECRLKNVRLSARELRHIEMVKRFRRRKTEAERKRDAALDELMDAKLKRMKMAVVQNSGNSNGDINRGSTSSGSTSSSNTISGDATDSDATAEDSIHYASTDDDDTETVAERRRRRLKKIRMDFRRQRKEHETNDTLIVYKPTVELTAKRCSDGSYVEIDPKTSRCVAEPCSKKPDASFWDMSTRDLASLRLRSARPKCQKCDQPMPMSRTEELRLAAIDCNLPLRVLDPIADGYSPLL